MWRDQQFQVKGDRLIWVQATSSNLAASHGAAAGSRNAGPDVPTPHAREKHARPAPPRRSVWRRAGLPDVGATYSRERSAGIHCVQPLSRPHLPVTCFSGWSDQSFNSEAGEPSIFALCMQLSA